MKRFTWILIAALAVVYVFSAKGYLEILDTQYSVETAYAIFDHQNLLITTDGEGALTLPDGRRYSKYGIGFASSFLPYVAIGTVLSHLTHMPRSDLVNFLLSFANIPYAIAVLILFGALLRKLDVTEPTILFLTLALGLGTLAWRYADYDYSEEIQMALLMLAVWGVVLPRRGEITWAGLSFALLVVVKLVHLVLLPVFLLYLVFTSARSDMLRRVIFFGLPSLAAIVLLGYLNAARFGNPLESGYGSEAGQFIPLQIWWTLPALFFSLDKGLLIFCPVLVLGLLGWPLFLRARLAPALLCGALISGILLVAAAWYGWDGGWAWGPRLVIPLIPLALVPAAFLLDAPAHRRWLPALVAICAISIACQVPGVVVKDQEIHLIKDMLSADQPGAVQPSDTVMCWQLFFHKLRQPGEIYHAGDFLSPPPNPNPLIDLSSYHTFAGFNVWTEQASRQFHHPVIRLVPLVGLFLLALLAAAAYRLRGMLPRA